MNDSIQKRISEYRYDCRTRNNKNHIPVLNFSYLELHILNHIPRGIRSLNCCNNSLTTLELHTITSVWCNSNCLTTLIAPMAKTVFCHNNRLTTLVLPRADHVWCCDNLLTHLVIPMVTNMWCNNNMLTTLVAPIARIIRCDNNNLTTIVAPRVSQLYCHNNKYLYISIRDFKNWNMSWLDNTIIRPHSINYGMYARRIQKCYRRYHMNLVVPKLIPYVKPHIPCNIEIVTLISQYAC